MTTKKKDPVVEPDRSAIVSIGGEDYELVLTTKATRLIAERYGGLEHLGNALETSDDLGKTLGEVIWLITLLANQSIQIHNHRHPDDKRPELTEDEVELLTVPADLADYRGAIAEALQRGTRRDILTEPAPKAPPADA
ncbi:hypothetical protein I4J32_03415 [Corynebacterium diphtheriae bv. mitis]|uniref:hypothetical protein n=1 Tax=Corynebacterium diphtheriae TaxID=1717 RepID=UPI0013CA0ABE|nr:hypothetical protein [Corynebacterium diphtheriae]MBG9312258.1 hypothetical protein [Corynebacterium diphtheriae bv. mitis]CAB0673992.1 hypothetical protein FRC0024_00112 [Corynebacterium diphtheriae]CAB0714139.1 hypothetical protein FRC0032_02130 [Corynebacterium diphtheriae]CAB0740726.1 hypothetical protein FRC0101_02101 [Corynebacterium diphtheriae]CAB0761704.1 hypothetical protein FRC0114_02100 [Corynebacterium diphtheriae]